MTTPTSDVKVDPFYALIARDFPDMPIAQFVIKCAEYRAAMLQSLQQPKCGCQQ
jgi:hypothetical protein